MAYYSTKIGRIVGASGALAVVIFSPLSAFGHKDRIEPTRTLTVGFKTGETATLAISDSAIASVTLHVGAADYTVPQGVCAKLRDIRFETVSLLWNGSFECASKADYFYLRFDMGSERARSFGELPRVQLRFRDAKFADATVMKKSAKDTWQYFTL